MPERKAHRLPTSVVPERYELSLTPDLRHWTFTGEEKIAIEVQEPVREIILNAAELELQNVALRLRDGRILPGSASLDTKNEQANVSFSETVPAGRHELQIKFSGILNDKLHGFYRSTYKDSNGVEKRLASTQFEST
ncbi:MAG TPA: M1 family peptidase, partial [Candidatus Binatia bacterium]|nr:M1 family peptidase [Candidatus Binatia bacterium]